eukprot:186407_1
MTVEELCKWINSKAIPIIRENENIYKEFDGLNTNYVSLEHKCKLLKDEFDIKNKVISEYEITNKNIIKDLNTKDLILNDKISQCHYLEIDYRTIQKEYEKLKLKKQKHINEKTAINTKDYIIENNKLKQEIISLTNQINDLQILYKEKITRLQNENNKLIIKSPSQSSQSQSQPPYSFLTSNLNFNDENYSHSRSNSNSYDNIQIIKSRERRISGEIKLQLNEQKDVLRSGKDIIESKNDKNEILKDNGMRSKNIAQRLCEYHTSNDKPRNQTARKYNEDLNERIDERINEMIKERINKCPNERHELFNERINEMTNNIFNF